MFLEVSENVKGDFFFLKLFSTQQNFVLIKVDLAFADHKLNVAKLVGYFCLFIVATGCQSERRPQKSYLLWGIV